MKDLAERTVAQSRDLLLAERLGDAGKRLDQPPDQVFAAVGLSPQDIATIRQRFTAWPRSAEGADRALEAGRTGAAPPGYPGWRPSRDAVAEEPMPPGDRDASRQDPEADR